MRPTLWRRAQQLLGTTAARLFLLVAALTAGAVFLSASAAPAGPVQPIAFNHQVMVQAGVQCLYCHNDALRSPSPGMPSVGLCMGCHKTIAADRPSIKQLAGYYDRGEAIPWARVNYLPRFVYYSHQVHLTVGGLNCETCHGDVGNMKVVEPAHRMSMGWCLECHSKQPNAPQLRDCVICHR
jgi:Cytochrome c7 and related cytochrome c